MSSAKSTRRGCYLGCRRYKVQTVNRTIVLFSQVSSVPFSLHTLAFGLNLNRLCKPSSVPCAPQWFPGRGNFAFWPYEFLGALWSTGGALLRIAWLKPYCHPQKEGLSLISSCWWKTANSHWVFLKMKAWFVSPSNAEPLFFMCVFWASVLINNGYCIKMSQFYEISVEMVLIWATS